MDIWGGILLGIVQGLTEFLPVSSSGHLVIIQSAIPGFRQPGVLFDAALHFGTLLAVTFFLRREILEILRALIPVDRTRQEHTRARIRPGRTMALYILIATVCTGIIGLVFEERIHTLFTSPRTTAVMLLITGILLFLADRFPGGRKEQDMNITDSIVIGLVQGMALIPGISRSGSTIAFGIFRGLDGAAAARFSFLLSIPAVLGALILESRYIEGVPPAEVPTYLAGMVAAAVTGFLTLGLLLFIIRKRRLRIFAYYCWILGISTLIIRTI